MLITLYQEGKSIQFLAEHFDASRPTIYKYLESEKRFEKNPFLTMRMIFMDGDKECTVIDVDFKHKKIYIRNKTKDILPRAFGVVEDPDWEALDVYKRQGIYDDYRRTLQRFIWFY